MRQPYRRSFPGREHQGRVLVEYVLFLTLLSAAMIFTGDAVAYATRDTLWRAPADLAIAPRHFPLEDLPGSPDLLASLMAPGTSERIPPYQFGIASLMMSCGALVWYGLYRRRTKACSAAQLTEELNESPPELGRDEFFTKRRHILRALAANLPVFFESRLEVRHLMTRQLVLASPETSREEIVSLMEEHQLRHILVCDHEGHLVGLISDRDLGNRSGRAAAQIMTCELLTVEPRAMIAPAITLLINKQISCLPIVQDGVPCGVLTSTDILMAFQCIMQLLPKRSLEQGAAGNLVGQGKSISGCVAVPQAAPVGAN